MRLSFEIESRTKWYQRRTALTKRDRAKSRASDSFVHSEQTLATNDMKVLIVPGVNRAEGKDLKHIWSVSSIESILIMNKIRLLWPPATSFSLFLAHIGHLKDYQIFSFFQYKKNWIFGFLSIYVPHKEL